MRSVQIEAILRRIGETRSKSDDRDLKRYWRDGSPAVELGAQYKTQIALFFVNRDRYLTKSAIEQAVFEQQASAVGPGDIPQRQAGLRDSSGPVEARRRYNISTYREWLNNSGKTAPKPDEEASVVRSVLMAADDLSVASRKPDTSFVDTLLSFKGSAEEAIGRCLDLFPSTSNFIDWTSFKKSKIISDVPSGPPRGLMDKSLKTRTDEVASALRTNRSVQVLGPHYSGKHQLLREVVAIFADTGFQTESGARIPILALSLHEVSPSEAIEHIAGFYADAVGIGQLGETVDEMLSGVAHCARAFPALFVIPGLETINENEIVRALRQDLLGEVITRILQGHPDTRLLVSTSEPSDVEDRSPQPGPFRRSVVERRTVRFDHDVRLKRRGVPAANYRYRALRQAAAALGELRGMSEQDVAAALGQDWYLDGALMQGAINGGALKGIGDFIATSLEPAEISTLALVALSADGLSIAEAKLVIAAFGPSMAADEPAEDGRLEQLDALPDEIVRKPLRRGLGSGATRYFVEKALRDHLLRYWRAEQPEQFRRACWVLARLATAEARRLRSRAGLDVSAGRDVQVLILLLASAPDINEETIDPDVAIDENTILPPIKDVAAALPSGRQIVRFAFEILFDQDLARSVRRGVPVLNDARLRLAAVHPFIDNSSPWSTIDDLSDRSRWRPSNSALPWSALDATEKVRLYEFATSSATRLNLGHLVTHFARSAEKLLAPAQLTPTQYGHLARIQRYELDLGIQLARNPDRRVFARRSSLEAAGLAEVNDRVELLIGEVPEGLQNLPEGRTATAKLKARRIEILHLRGRHKDAYREMLALAGGDGGLPGMSRDLGGRSRRMFLRLLVELARARLFEVVDVPVRYDDKLVLPMLHRSELRPKTLLAAERLANQSLRELSIGRPSDWIGVKIDQARIASVKVLYVDALTYLEEAAKVMHARGTTRDIVLELLSVQCRTYVDAAAFSVATGDLKDLGRRKVYMTEVATLGRYLGIGEVDNDPAGWKLCDQTASRLCERATDSLEILRELTQTPEAAGSRFAMFANYLDTWIAVVRSRLHRPRLSKIKAAAAVREELDRVGLQLGEVLKAMTGVGYFLHHREVHLLVDGLRLFGVEVPVPGEFPSAQTGPDETT